MYIQVLYPITVLAIANGDYQSERARLIKAEENKAIGNGIELTDKEKVVNDFLMEFKFKEYDDGIANPQHFLASKHFFEARDGIKNSTVFKFIRKMPKGAVLHAHNTALLSFEKLFNLTYKDNLYACTVSGRVRLQFMIDNKNQECDWQLVKDIRKANPAYDSWLMSQMSLLTENPKEKYRDINEVWTVFQSTFSSVTPMLNYRPIYEEYLREALIELLEDNVSYLEFRSSLSALYELNGTIYNKEDTAGIFKKVIDDFVKDYPNFIGARMIYSPRRSVDEATVAQYVKTANMLKTQYPDFLVGFDLVGQENLKALREFITQLKTVSASINFIFHAGETNWYGTDTDQNMVDAILLGTKRIGHGYAITKHPLLMSLVKRRGIAIEICPISNQVLMLVDDLRNHPAAHLIANGYPVVISNDDPSFWGSKGLSYDFYLAFMAMASRNSDLRLLKKLAENSLTYSALPNDKKKLALRKWQNQWNAFIGTMHTNIGKFTTLI